MPIRGAFGALRTQFAKMKPAHATYIKTFLAALLVVIGEILLTVFVGNYENRSALEWAMAAIGLIVVIAIASIVPWWLTSHREKVRDSRLNIESHLSHAVSEVYLKRDSRIRSGQDRLEVAHQQLFDLLKALRDTLASIEARQSLLPGERPYLEATFLAQSQKDGELTIAAWACPDDRPPTSLSERGENPRRYAGTEAAKIYREATETGGRPEIHYISSTGDSDYEHLYERQLKKIRSTAVSPVMSAESELVGVIAACSGRREFFSAEDKDFWVNLLDSLASHFAAAMAELSEAKPEAARF